MERKETKMSEKRGARKKPDLEKAALKYTQYRNLRNEGRNALKDYDLARADFMAGAKWMAEYLGQPDAIRMVRSEPESGAA